MVEYCKKKNSEIEKIPTYLYFMIYLSAFLSEIFNASIIKKRNIKPTYFLYCTPCKNFTWNQFQNFFGYSENLSKWVVKETLNLPKLISRKIWKDVEKFSIFYTVLYIFRFCIMPKNFSKVWKPTEEWMAKFGYFDQCIIWPEC